MDNKCACTESKKSMFQKCCCRTYRGKKPTNGTSESNKIWQIICQKTKIIEKCGELKIEFKCSCSDFSFCSCCQESRKQESVYLLEKFFNEQFKANPSSNFLLNCLVEGIKMQTTNIDSLKIEHSQRIESIEQKLNSAQQELGMKESDH